MSLLSSSIGGVRYHADEDADHNMLQGKSRLFFLSHSPAPAPRAEDQYSSMSTIYVASRR